MTQEMSLSCSRSFAVHLPSPVESSDPEYAESEYAESEYAEAPLDTIDDESDSSKSLSSVFSQWSLLQRSVSIATLSESRLRICVRADWWKGKGTCLFDSLKMRQSSGRSSRTVIVEAYFLIFTQK